MNVGLIAGGIAAVAVGVALICWRGWNTEKAERLRLESALELYRKADDAKRKAVDEFLTQRDERGKKDAAEKQTLDAASGLPDADFWRTIDRVFQQGAAARGDSPAVDSASSGK